jgi:hypothetical protein
VALLDELLLAHGGLDRWRRVQRFTLHVSMGGTLIRDKCGSATLKDLVVQGSTREHSLECIGFTAADLLARCRADGVMLECRDTGTLKEECLPAAEFREQLRAARWDELRLAYFCGCAIWSYVAQPFCLADPDVRTQEIACARVGGQTWRRLQVELPERLAAFSADQTLYVNGATTLRRLDHSLPHESHTRVAQEFRGYQAFSGFMVPTLSRLSAMEPDGTIVSTHALFDIEVFDAAYEP